MTHLAKKATLSLRTVDSTLDTGQPYLSAGSAHREPDGAAPGHAGLEGRPQHLHGQHRQVGPRPRRHHRSMTVTVLPAT